MKSRLKMLRAERDWIQIDLAEQLSVTRQTVNAIETSMYEPSLSLAFKISKVFQMPVKRLWHDCTVGNGVDVFPQEVFMKSQLKVLREERNWTQADLAERLGVSRQIVNTIETSKYNLSPAFQVGLILQEIRVKSRLKVLRAERDWTQADLAEQLGVSRQTVNAIETGKYDPSLALAFKISTVFQMPIESIFEVDDSES